MQLLRLLISWLGVVVFASAQSTRGIIDLVQRRLPNHVDDFTFRILEDSMEPINTATNVSNDVYSVSSTPDGKILVEGNSLIALASGWAYSNSI